MLWLVPVGWFHSSPLRIFSGLPESFEFLLFIVLKLWFKAEIIWAGGIKEEENTQRGKGTCGQSSRLPGFILVTPLMSVWWRSHCHPWAGLHFRYCTAKSKLTVEGLGLGNPLFLPVWLQCWPSPCSHAQVQLDTNCLSQGGDFLNDCPSSIWWQAHSSDAGSKDKHPCCSMLQKGCPWMDGLPHFLVESQPHQLGQQPPPRQQCSLWPQSQLLPPTFAPAFPGGLQTAAPQSAVWLSFPGPDFGLRLMSATQALHMP